MKKLFFLLLFTSSFIQAQFIVNGTLTEVLESDWIILYKIESTKQVFVANTTIKKEALEVNGKNVTVGTFSFTLPKNAKSGSYRATYKLEGAGFVDFVFNKENIGFAFNPNYPEETIQFSDSKENLVYKKYLEAIYIKQQKLDSIQVAVLKDKTLNLDTNYKEAFNDLNAVQNQFLKGSKEMYIHPFIKATLRKNPSEILKTPQKYMSNLTTTFFDNMDFSNPTLINSSFLTNRITDYLFYVNYSDNKAVQNTLYKKSIDKILSKISSLTYRKDIIEFIIAQFEATKNLEVIDYLLNDYYKKLPKEIRNDKFISEKNALFAAEIGRVAPDFSWTENGEKLSLSSLKEAKNYIIVFWSTDCSHCLREVPQLHQFMQAKKDIKVIAFAMERNDFGWKNMKKTLPNWHHVLGLNKWENKIARTYNVMSTPSYFVLDKNKKIIGKPDELKDVKAFLEKLK